MKTHKCEKDNKYIISTNSDCVVTDVETGIVLAVVLAKTQKVIVAISDSFTTSVECSIRPFVEATVDIDIIGGGEDYLPAGYKKLEYLESPSTPDNLVLAYFKLPLPHVTSPNDSIMYETEHMFMPKGTIVQGEGVPLNCGSFLIGNHGSWGKFVAIDGVLNNPSAPNSPNVDWNISFSCSDFEWHRIKYELGSRQDAKLRLSIDDVLVEERELVWFSDLPARTYFYLFGAPPTYIAARALCGKKRAAKIWVNGTLIYDLVPVLDEAGIACMYDKVSHQSYYNSGSGDFITPPDEYDTQTLDLDDVVYGKMTEYGIRRLYKVPAGETMSLTDYALANGYKQIVEQPMPTDGYWVHQWAETDTQLILEWIETEAPVEEV